MSTQQPTDRPAAPRRRVARLAVVGTLAVGAVLGGSAAAIAAQAPGGEVVTSPTADGYDSAQQKAFWEAGYTVADQDALAELWNTDWRETKVAAGQKLMDGEPLPIAPGSTGRG